MRPGLRAFQTLAGRSPPLFQRPLRPPGIRGELGGPGLAGRKPGLPGFAGRGALGPQPGPCGQREQALASHWVPRHPGHHTIDTTLPCPRVPAPYSPGPESWGERGVCRRRGRSGRGDPEQATPPVFPGGTQRLMSFLGSQMTPGPTSLPLWEESRAARLGIAVP